MVFVRQTGADVQIEGLKNAEFGKEKLDATPSGQPVVAGCLRCSHHEVPERAPKGQSCNRENP